jgi:hypothetical protein
MFVDPTGTVAWLAIVGLAVIGGLLATQTGCNSTPLDYTEEIMNAGILNMETSPQDKYNCYGAALGLEVSANPIFYENSPYAAYEAVKRDVGEKNVRIVQTVYGKFDYDPVSENLVALRTGPYDYHFIVNVDGIWYNKQGLSKVIKDDESYVTDKKPWGERYCDSEGELRTKFTSAFANYDSETVYFAIKKEWRNK